jgi:imidazolonepropionase-like amidohydrolase
MLPSLHAAAAAAAAGLCDAHVHVTATTANLAGLYSLPESLVTARAADILEGMISRGFTTVRDAGGQVGWWACMPGYY